LQTVRGVCLAIIPLHNKQYNVYKKNTIFFPLTWSDLLISQANFAKFFPNYSRTSSRTVRFGLVRKCLSSSPVRFEDFQKCTPLLFTWHCRLLLCCRSVETREKPLNHLRISNFWNAPPSPCPHPPVSCAQNSATNASQIVPNTNGGDGRTAHPSSIFSNFRLDMFSSAQLLDLSVARYFFQMRLDSRRISLDFLLEILKPQNFPSISVKFP
jgi:hypothetical protein